MTTIFDEETDEQSASRFDQETAEIDGRLEPEGEVISAIGSTDRGRFFSARIPHFD